MLVTFLNVPCDICWNEGVEMMFSAELESILGNKADKETYRVREHESNVHVIISEAPLPFPVNCRKAVAKQIFQFLKYHAVLEKADVYFANFDGEQCFDDRYFEPLDVGVN